MNISLVTNNVYVYTLFNKQNVSIVINVYKEQLTYTRYIICRKPTSN